MKKVLLTMLVLYSAAIGAQENQRTRFSVDEAIVYALDFNRNLKNASRDLKDAEAQKWMTIASGLPQIAGSVQYQNQLKQPVAQIPAEFFGGAPGFTCKSSCVDNVLSIISSSYNILPLLVTRCISLTSNFCLSPCFAL